MNRILEVSTRSGTAQFRPCAEEERAWGGRSFIAHHLQSEVEPGCDPLGPTNRLIIAHGLLGDTKLTTAGRVSIGGKSPLTGGVKEANVGGSCGRRMARLGIKAIILKDTPENRTPRILLVRNDGADLIDTPDLAGKETSTTLAYLRERFGAKTGVLAIGPAGEKLVRFAGIISDHAHSSSHNGVGAVMGSKNLKAIVVERGHPSAQTRAPGRCESVPAFGRPGGGGGRRGGAGHSAL